GGDWGGVGGGVAACRAPPRRERAGRGAGGGRGPRGDPSFCWGPPVWPPLPGVIPPPVTRPGPVTETLRSTSVVEPPENVAVTLFALVIVTVQAWPVPLQAPPHPVNVDPDSGVAVSVMLEPATSF